MIIDLIGKSVDEHYCIGDKWVTVIREDLAYKDPLPHNAKMSALYEIIRENRQHKTMGILAKKQTGQSYSIGLPVIAQDFGIKPIIFYPSNGEMPDWLSECQKKYNTEVVLLHPNMVTININQAKKIMEDKKGYFIPFGFEDKISVHTHSERFNIYRNIGTLVMATMTGMTLAGAIDNIKRGNKRVENIIGISCGREPKNIFKSMEKFINVPNNVEIINPYERNFDPPLSKDLELFPLHPDYEKKAWYWLTENIDRLKPPIVFINVGA